MSGGADGVETRKSRVQNPVDYKTLNASGRQAPRNVGTSVVDVKIEQAGSGSHDTGIRDR